MKIHPNRRRSHQRPPIFICYVPARSSTIYQFKLSNVSEMRCRFFSIVVDILSGNVSRFAAYSGSLKLCPTLKTVDVALAGGVMRYRYGKS